MKEPLTAKELIKLLKTVNPEAKVILSGCDCYGDAAGIEHLDKEIVRITRTDD